MTSFEEELQNLDGQSLKRELSTVTQTEGSKIVIGDKSYINFSSNNYLGLARHPQVIEAAKEVLGHWGVGATSSRLISGSTILHDDLESALAAYTGHEAALLYPTGYQANIGAITTLVGQGDAIILDRLCHASLLDAARLTGARLFVYEHLNADAAKQALARASNYPRRLLVTESLFSMDGDFAPQEALLAAAKKFKAISMIDEAHAIGVWDLAKGWDVTVGTLSKALGSQGGFVAASKAIKELMINKARSFIYTTGLSPVCIAAAQAALGLVQEDPKPAAEVRQLSNFLRASLQKQGWNTLGSDSQIVPILLGNPKEALRVAARIKEAGFYAPAIRPPTVHAGECRLRFSVTADHSEEDINQLLTTLSHLGRGALQAG